MQKKRTDDNLNNAKTLPDGIDDPDTDDWGQFVCIDDVQCSSWIHGELGTGRNKLEGQVKLGSPDWRVVIHRRDIACCSYEKLHQ